MQSFFLSSWQEAGVQEALGKLLTTEHMSSSMKLLTLQGWSLVKFSGHRIIKLIINFLDPRLILVRIKIPNLAFCKLFKRALIFFLSLINRFL